MSRDLFYFSKGDRRAVLVLLSVIIAVNAIRYGVGRFTHGTAPELAEVEVPDSASLQTASRTQLHDEAIQTARHEGRSQQSQRETGRQPTQKAESRVNYNRRTYSDTLYIIRNETHADTLESMPDRWVRKSRPAEPVDLNRADTTALKLLPGIGSYYARRIVEYRDRLGGYIRPEQILEMDVLPDSLIQWFTVTDTIPFRRIKVNSDALATMRNHPYMNFYQARAITDLRKSIGIIKNSARLTLLEEFTEQDLVRLSPYLDFDQ